MTLRCLAIALAIFAVTTSDSLGQQSKQQPSQQNKVAEADKSSQADQRGTKGQPITVNIISTEEQKADAEKEKRQAELKATDDHKVVSYTLDLVFVGIIQFLVFVLQLIAFSLQARYMKRTVVEMRRTTHTTIRATRAAQSLAERQHLAAYRPKLQVRHVSVVDPGEIVGMRAFFFDPNSNVRGGLSVVNIGGSSAIIIETRYRIFASKTGLPIEAPYDSDPRLDLIIPDQKLTMGQSLATPIQDTIRMGMPEDGIVELGKFDREGWVLYVMGQIRYRDEGGNDRFMGFCRERHSDGRFRAVNDPDYEYQD